MVTSAQTAVTVEQFSKDLWGVVREQIRAQFGDAVTDAEFSKRFPPWDELPLSARRDKMVSARDEILRLLDSAGYEVRKKI